MKSSLTLVQLSTPVVTMEYLNFGEAEYATRSAVSPFDEAAAAAAVTASRPLLDERSNGTIRTTWSLFGYPTSSPTTTTTTATTTPISTQYRNHISGTKTGDDTAIETVEFMPVCLDDDEEMGFIHRSLQPQLQPPPATSTLDEFNSPLLQLHEIHKDGSSVTMTESNASSTMNSWTHFMDEAYDCASNGVSHLVRMQQQYVRERQDRKRAAVAAVAVVLAMVVAYGWAYSNALDYDSGSDSLGQPHD